MGTGRSPGKSRPKPAKVSAHRSTESVDPPICGAAGDPGGRLSLVARSGEWRELYSRADRGRCTSQRSRLRSDDTAHRTGSPDGDGYAHSVAIQATICLLGRQPDDNTTSAWPYKTTKVGT